jgi:uncharacterized protein with HEPN domain
MWHERNWRMRVEDILVCIDKIKTYTLNMTFEQFSSDDKTVDAVIRNFEIIGEAASHIPLEIQDQYPHLAWLEMRGMRNIIAHEYFGVSLSIIWHTAEYDLPKLEKELRTLLENQN